MALSKGSFKGVLKRGLSKGSLKGDNKEKVVALSRN